MRARACEDGERASERQGKGEGGRTVKDRKSRGVLTAFILSGRGILHMRDDGHVH